MMTGLLGQWRQAFDERDRCPWPGPRPLREEDAELLIGRAQDRRAFQRVIRENRLVLFHGSSGVGKSSLLQAGLVPDMERSRKTVYAADQWGGAQTGNLSSLLADRLKLPGTGRSAFDEVNRDSVVIVLDQFEELIRYSPQRADEVFDLVVDLNRNSDIKIVISFRSEFLHEFTNLESRLVNFTAAQFALGELAPETAEQVIRAGNRRRDDNADDEPLDAIDDEAVGRIATAWRLARLPVPLGADDPNPLDRIGLLHLQALLYALHFDGDGHPITANSLAGLPGLSDARSDPDPREARVAFRAALQRSVDHKLSHCRHAAADIAVDGDTPIGQALVEGTHWAVIRTVRHLSSAGYKLIRQASELGDLILGVDLAALRDGLAVGGAPDDKDLDRLFDGVLRTAGMGKAGTTDGGDGGVDLLEADRPTLAAQADEPVDGSWPERLASAPADIAADPVGVTAGPMMRLDPADVLVEEYRRIVFGLVWLEESALVRVTSLPGTGAMISLIHDGFGSALVEWGQSHEKQPEGPLSAITAPRGASFGWRPGRASSGEERSADIGGAEVHRVLPNLVWRGAWIQADLEAVVFLNCDLRGLLLDGCRLTGVNFINCLLDGAIFSDCVITGPVDLAEDGRWSVDEPSFVVQAPAELVADHARYRGVPHAEAAFLSPLPGDPAVPFQGEPGNDRLRGGGSTKEERGRLDAPLAKGGVVVHGGRVSNLVVRGTTIEAGSSWYMRHTVGSGLDFVELPEQTTPMKIVGSALRHVSISPKVDGPEASIAIEIDGSALTQLWVAPRVNGSVTARDSRVVHLWNGSPQRPAPEKEQEKNDHAKRDDPSTEKPKTNGVEFLLTAGSTFHGLVDVNVDASCTSLGPGPQTVEFDRLGDGGLRDQQAKMDYRRNPALTKRHGTPTTTQRKTDYEPGR